MTDKQLLEQALEALEKANGALEQADCSTGYCCCGSSVDGHTFGDGHSPVDQGEYCQSNALKYAHKAITAIRARLEQPEEKYTYGTPLLDAFTKPAPVQEPVACKSLCELCVKRNYNFCANAAKTTPIPTPPATQRQWVGLTDEERNHARHTVTYSQLAMTAGEWAEAVQIETEKRIKEKNT